MRTGRCDFELKNVLDSVCLSLALSPSQLYLAAAFFDNHILIYFVGGSTLMSNLENEIMNGNGGNNNSSAASSSSHDPYDNSHNKSSLAKERQDKYNSFVAQAEREKKEKEKERERQQQQQQQASLNSIKKGMNTMYTKEGSTTSNGSVNLATSVTSRLSEMPNMGELRRTIKVHNEGILAMKWINDVTLLIATATGTIQVIHI